MVSWVGIDDLSECGKGSLLTQKNNYLPSKESR